MCRRSGNPCTSAIPSVPVVPQQDHPDYSLRTTVTRVERLTVTYPRLTYVLHLTQEIGYDPCGCFLRAATPARTNVLLVLNRT
jgi:hypothetical protein